MVDMSEEDNQYYEVGSVVGDKFLCLIEHYAFWPKGEGTIEKRILASAKAKGAKVIFLNDVTTGDIYVEQLDKALAGGNQELAVLMKHNMRKGSDDDMR